jgi:hypothetical protein
MSDEIFKSLPKVEAPRPTRAAAFVLATLLSVPVFLGLTALEWLMF